MPYGVLKDTEWDKLFTGPMMDQALKQFAAVNEAPAYTVFLYHDYRQAGFVHDHLKAYNYTFVQPVYWYKNNQNVSGPNNILTSAVETCTVARFVNGQPKNLEMQLRLDSDPVKRHNHIESKTNSEYLKYENGETVNPTQKPLAPGVWFLSRFVRPGGTVVIVGCGAGGEIAACLELGINCVAIDTDEEQLRAVAGWLDVKQNEQQRSVEMAKKLQDKELKKIELLGVPADKTRSCLCCGVKLCFGNVGKEQRKCTVCREEVCGRPGCGGGDIDGFDESDSLMSSFCRNKAKLLQNEQKEQENAAAPVESAADHEVEKAPEIEVEAAESGNLS